MKRIGIIDYGMGNLHSVENALRYIGADCFISENKAELSKADGLILPGVGAFPDAIEKLSGLGFPDFIRGETKKSLCSVFVSECSFSLREALSSGSARDSDISRATL